MLGQNFLAATQFAFKSPVSERIRNQGADAGHEILLPIEFEEARQNWEFNQEVGYRVLENGSFNQVTYGLATTYNIRDGLAVLGELHGNVYQDFRDQNFLLNFGTVVALNKSMNLLVSAGKALKSYQDEKNPFVSYAGMQFRL